MIRFYSVLTSKSVELTKGLITTVLLFINTWIYTLLETSTFYCVIYYIRILGISTFPYCQDVKEKKRTLSYIPFFSVLKISIRLNKLTHTSTTVVFVIKKSKI